MNEPGKNPCGLCEGRRVIPRWAGVGAVPCPWCSTPEDSPGASVVKREIVEAVREIQQARAA
jgi:hypothetical protein